MKSKLKFNFKIKMLISLSILNSSFENYQKKLAERENYKEDTTRSIILGVDSAFA